MCESQRVAVASPVLQGVAVAGVCAGIAAGVWALVGTVAFLAAPVLALSLPIGLAVKVNRSHRLPAGSRAVVRPARKTLDAAPARLALESARSVVGDVVEGVVLTEKAEVER